MSDRADERHLHAVTEDTDERPLPHDYEQEKAVLGGCINWRTDLEQVTYILNPGDFYRPAHERIYDAMTRVYARNEPVTILSIADRLGDHLERVGGIAYLTQLATNAIAPGNATYYAPKLANLSVGRHLIAAAMRQMQLGYSVTSDTNIDHLLDDAAHQLDFIPRGVPGVDRPITDTWAPVDLAPIVTGDLTPPAATLCARRDGKLLLYPGAVHSVAGEPGSGKTWFAMVAIAQQLEAGNPVMMIDFEDRPQTIVSRLLALGVPTDTITTHLRYIRPETALNPTSRQYLTQATEGITLAVIDGITEAMTLHGLSLMDNEDIARWLALIPRYLADQGAAVLQVDHVVKNADNRGRFAIGGQHKLAGITGVAYKMLTIRSFGKGAHGHAKLVIDKDKHGDVGPNGLTAADLHLDATNLTGTLYGWLDAPEKTTDDDGEFRPTLLMERVSTFLLARPGAQSFAAISAGVKGKNESIVQAIDALVREGFARIEDGPRNSKQVTLLESFPRPE